MELIKNKSFGGERPLFGAHDVRLEDITITDVSASSGEIAYNLSAGTIIKAKATAELSVTFNPISDKAFHGMLNFKTDCPDDDLFRVYIKGVPPAKK